LASFYTERSAWIADAGEYRVKIGTSSRDITKAVSFRLEKEIVTEKTHKSLSPEAAIDELNNKQK